MTIFGHFRPQKRFFEIFWLKIISRQWLRARWKRIYELLLIKEKLFKKFNFFEVCYRMTIFGYFGPKTHSLHILAENHF